MRLCRIETPEGGSGVALIEGDRARLLRQGRTLAELLHAPNTEALVQSLVDVAAAPLPLAAAKLLPPIDGQEVWAAGVTYRRSKVAREAESAGAASFYDRVYAAERPELFFKATPRRVVGPGQGIRIRRDSRWTVPEPELAAVIGPDFRLVGFTIGNDVSARDIEGENPLYLPQAKIYEGSCALGPVVTLPEAMPAAEQTSIHLGIRRRGCLVFEGATTMAAMARSLSDLTAWLGRENCFPEGVILLSGTGIVPPDDFSLQAGDEVAIEITGIGRLVNPVAA